MDSSEIVVKKEIKDETVEIFDVPIKTETKPVQIFEANREIKSELGLQIGIDITNKLDFSVKKEIQDDYYSDISSDEEYLNSDLNGTENKKPKDQEKPSLAFCSLCQARVPVNNNVGALDDHLNGKKHKKNLKEKCTIPEINSTNFIITDPTQMPYYCSLCEVFCGSENSWGLHLNGKQHDITMLHYELCNIQKENGHGNDLPGKEHQEKANEEKKNEFEKGATLFMEGFTRDTREIDIQKLLMDTFDVQEKEFASIKKEQTCGYVRFHYKETAIELVAKINEYLGKSEMLKVKGADINFRILEGKEETVYLDHTLRQGLL